MRSNSSFKAYRDSTVKMRAARALILLVGAVMALWGVQGSKKPPDPPTGRSVRMGRTTEPAATADAAVGPCRRNKPQRTASSRRQQGGTQTQERWGPRADAWRPQPSEHHPLQQQPSSPETYTTAAAAGGGGRRKAIATAAAWRRKEPETVLGTSRHRTAQTPTPGTLTGRHLMNAATSSTHGKRPTCLQRSSRCPHSTC